MWILESTDDEEEIGDALEVPPGETRTIGRDAAADLVLDRPLVSRVHCRVEAQTSGLRITDLNSTNGTFVNDRRIKDANLAAGDRVTVGRTILEVKRQER